MKISEMNEQQKDFLATLSNVIEFDFVTNYPLTINNYNHIIDVVTELKKESEQLEIPSLNFYGTIITGLMVYTVYEPQQKNDVDFILAVVNHHRDNSNINVNGLIDFFNHIESEM